MISSGSPHVLRAHIGRTCREPGEIELTPRGGDIERLLRHAVPHVLGRDHERGPEAVVVVVAARRIGHASTPSTHGQHTASTRPARRRHTASTRSAYRQHTGSTSPAHGQHAVSIPSAHGQHVAGTRPARGQHTVSTGAVRRQHVASTRAARGRHALGTCLLVVLTRSPNPRRLVSDVSPCRLCLASERAVKQSVGGGHFDFV